MSLTQQFYDEFSSQARSRGTSYARRNVSVVEEGKGFIVASVEGSSGGAYEVILWCSDPRQTVEMSCTCPHYADGFNCKHVWAVILYCEQHKIDLGIKGPRIYAQFLDPEDLAATVFALHESEKIQARHVLAESPRYDWREGTVGSAVRTGAEH